MNRLQKIWPEDKTELMSKRLNNEVAIVTGGADGIGRAIVKMFCEQGAKVCIADLNAKLGEPLADELSAKGFDVLFVNTDVGNSTNVSHMVSQTVETLGAPTILINNAGWIPITEDPLEATDDLWDKLFQCNLNGMWNCSRAVIPYMQACGRGSIVNLGSVHSHQIVKGHFPYAVTKHAVIGLTRSLAVEFAKDKIRVNTLCPGMVETPTAFKVWSEMDDPEGVRQAVANLHPLKMNAAPEDMAYAAVFLASQESRFMTGQDLVIDGGRSALYHD